MIVLAAVLLLQTPAAPPAAPVQDTASGRPCRVAVDSMGHFAQVTNPGGDTTTHGGGGVLAHCVGTGTTISADSFVHSSGVNRLDLIGRVQIRDTSLALDANLASYYLKEERLEAHNHVVAVNRRTGSILRGPNLRYLRAAPGIRDTVEMYATQRPTVEYRSNAAGDTTTEPYIIVADRMRFKGDDRMWGGGRVTVDRSDFASRSDSLLLDQTRGFGVLVGAPYVEGRGTATAGEAGKRYTLVGTRIELALAQRDVRGVNALGNGKATGADWTLTADTIHLIIANRLLQQTFAWGDTLRPHAISTLYTIRADSLVIDSPNEVLRESRAYGHAYSTERRDSTLPASETDWITGDSMTIRFAQQQDSATEQPHTRLRELISYGGARALTHQVQAHDTTAAEPAINYSRGERITLVMQDERIDHVVVAGKADGLHLEPRAAVTADSVRRAQEGALPPP